MARWLVRAEGRAVWERVVEAETEKVARRLAFEADYEDPSLDVVDLQTREELSLVRKRGTE
jgi:dihydroorotase-like cyclic amidohydrolase